MYRIKETVVKILPKWLKGFIRPIWRTITKINEHRIIKGQAHRHTRALERIKKTKNKKIKVAFFALDSAVWKYEKVYKVMEEDARFEVVVVICPIINYGKDNMIEIMQKTYNFFSRKDHTVIKTYDKEKDEFLDIKKEINPDIIFFANPHRLTKEEYYITHYKNTLSCYTQYSFHVTNLNDNQYNQLFHNLLWKAFYETEIHGKLAAQYSRNQGNNVVITGYPGTDEYSYGGRTGKNVWKNTDINLKRIIWAPHHTLDMEEQLGYSCFLKYHQIMLDIARKYSDKVQIAFKPHPILKLKLYDHENWGKEKTDAYYKTWSTLENGQLETDSYVDLFNSSDAMIFDSASFVAEYLCCGKPSLFTFFDSNVEVRFNEFGKLALNQHYQGYNEEDIIDFIENTVCKEHDIKKEDRKVFYNNFLQPPHNKKAYENIYDEICEALFE